jgi:hypothetical protein
MENQDINSGEVTDLWRFPVKSMGGEQLKELEITAHGVVGDRTYALLDKQTGKVVSAKNSKFFPEILNCSARFVSRPLQHEKIPAVIVTLPSGETVSSDDPAANDKLSEFFGREVNLIQTAPADFTIDQFHPDIAGLDLRLPGSGGFFSGCLSGFRHHHFDNGQAQRAIPSEPFRCAKISDEHRC